MKQKQRFISFLLAWLMVATFGYAIALPQLQDDKKKTHTSTVQSVQLDEDTIPDSLLHTRWQIQRTQPYSLSDLYQSPLDLKRPDNLQYQVVYNDTIDRYIIGNRMGSTWLSAPIMLTPKENLSLQPEPDHPRSAWPLELPLQDLFPPLSASFGLCFLKYRTAI